MDLEQFHYAVLIEAALSGMIGSITSLVIVDTQ